MQKEDQGMDDSTTKAITPAAAARAEAERHVAASQSINEKIALDRQKRQDEQKKQAQTERDAINAKISKKAAASAASGASARLHPLARASRSDRNN